jgi:deoxyribodipyrimidine photolyase
LPLALWWIRRDLRLIDNPALSAALAEGYSFLPVFVLDPHLLSRRASGISKSDSHALPSRQEGSARAT